MQIHLEAQQRAAIPRDPAERMKFAPPDLRVGESVFFTGKMIGGKFNKDGNLGNG